MTKISTYITTISALFFQSTLEQTIKQSLLFSDEIVVVNSEHSSDGTYELLDTLHSQYPNIIKLYTFKEDYSKKWETVAEKKTFALKKCTGDWCILQDDDECIHEDYAQFIKDLPKICPETIAIKFNTLHFYRSFNHYHPPNNDWYSSKIYMVKNIPEIQHGLAGNDPDAHIFVNSDDDIISSIPLYKLSVPKVVETPVTSFHYGWCRNDAILLYKKYIQEMIWWGKDYWKTKQFPFKFEDPTKMPEYKGTHPKCMKYIVNMESACNSRNIKELTDST